MSPGPDSLNGIAARYAAATGAQPVFLIEGAGGLFAAKWRLPPHRVASPWAPHHVLGYRVSGISTIVRSCRGVTQRKVPPIGSVTFSPGDRPVEWSSDAPIEAIHVYIHADALPGLAIGDFFGITDPWLAGYCRLLEGDVALYGDSLFLQDTQHLLLRHLARHYSNGARKPLEPRARVAPLGRGVVRRIEEYLEANLAADVSLHALAALAHLSVDHFVRAFRGATGKTPHRFALERRLERAAALLKGPASIAQIAHACGFRSAAHFSVRFHARFGVTPSHYRHSA
ncbi:MAG TPA: AraC family transcriptional regulator [Burkholderiales bacterium]|nr:AraC family transcriptional regulator [Burkholderiales bacterium]